MSEQPAQPSRRRAGLLAIACIGLAYAAMIQPLGWNQTSHMALVKSLAHGTARIDRYQWETGDKSYIGDHFYSAKSPGMDLLAFPWYELLRSADGPEALGDLADRRKVSKWSKAATVVSPFVNRTRGPERDARVARPIYRETPLAWALGLAVVVAPALVLLLLVRSLADKVEPGLGTAVAVTLGLGTIILPFSTMLFSHLLAATLGFAAFALLWREREGPPRPVLLAAAGALAGLGVFVEYPLGLLVLILGGYAVSRGPWVRRALSFGAGAVAGVLPLAAYNLWAFGSLTTLSYRNAVKIPGRTGHDVLGLNSAGLFGVQVPSPHAALQLLFSGRGLLVITPVVAMGAIGTVLLHRRGKRAEALTIGAVAIAYFVYNAGYYVPFGGDTPGPRFLLAVLPFLAVPLGLSFRRFPAVTSGLALASAATMVLATATDPQIGNDRTAHWVHLLGAADFEPTVLTAAVGVTGWVALIPFLAGVGGAVALTMRATARLPVTRHQLGLGAAAVAVWAIGAVALPPLIGSTVSDRPRLSHVTGSPSVVLIALGFALAGLAVAGAAPRLSGGRGRRERRHPAPAG